MNITLHLKPYMEEIIEGALGRGIAQTKSETIRMGLLALNEKYGLAGADKELEQDLLEVNRIEKDIKVGKEKLYVVKDLDELFK